MKYTACLCLMLALAIVFCGCGASSSHGEEEQTTTASAMQQATQEEILFSKTILSDSIPFYSLEAVARTAPVIIKVTVISKDSAIVIGDYTKADLERYDEYARANGEVATDLLLSIRTPYTVKITEIYHQDEAIDGLAVDDVMQICALGGVCCDVEVDQDSVELVPQTEYIIALRRRAYAKGDEPRYTLYKPQSSAYPVDSIGTAIASTDPNYSVMSGYASVAQFEQALRMYIAQAQEKDVQN